ncbi:MAG: tRNA 4-thiouridine(8) synthase ThiI [Spirochaetaceae bacterium]|jgi:thiamine biosynthesis protein ThiI|nr:tRNA 4-thiouridine(8) synthase ThiI [Spirochaetaceae bacterium]
MEKTRADRITWLLKPGELTLKGRNRPGFERALCRNLAARLKGTGAELAAGSGRLYVHAPSGADEDTVQNIEAALEKIFGIAGWARTVVAAKTREAVFAALIDAARECVHRGVSTFKIEARRTDKSFPLDSWAMRSEGGAAVLDAVPSLRVDVHHPEALIEVEIRERAYIYAMGQKGRRGLPVGTAGRGLLLLSGGIDSPVAGYLMESRGMGLDAVYFHAWPYTSDEARLKAVKLAEITGSYGIGIRLHTVDFAGIEIRIKENAPESWATILLRMAMMEAAERLARRRNCKCLITGESLSQVASQTIENITCTQSRITSPVMRPLIGMDKESIIRIAESIGTYATSILPYADCCALFSPAHPVLHGDPDEAGGLYESLDLSGLIQTALETAREEKCGFP